jgi:hypothetical protein
MTRQFEIIYANRSWYVVDNSDGQTVDRFKGMYGDKAAEQKAIDRAQELTDKRQDNDR